MILTDVFAAVASGFAAVIFEGTLPEPLRTYAAAEEVHPFLLIVALLLLVLMIVAWVGLWRNASWAPPVYAVMWAGCAFVVPFGGPYVGTGIEEMFDFVGTSAGGGILVLVLLTMQERRNAGSAPLAGEQTTSETLSHAGSPVHSNEPMQPHIKSWCVHRVLSWLYGLIALMMFARPFVARAEKELRPREMAIALIIPLFFSALFFVHHVVSRGAKERKRWARISSIVLACLLLLNVPLGTLVGFYLLRNRSWEPSSAAAPDG